jgi:hypothetical protein
MAISPAPFCPSSSTEPITITIQNEDCNAADLYIDGRKVATIGGYSSSSIEHYQGYLTFQACTAGTSNCGAKTRYQYNSDNTFRIYDNGCN